MSEPEPQEKKLPIRYACCICDQLFGNYSDACNHVSDTHIKTIMHTYIRPTYREN